MPSGFRPGDVAWGSECPWCYGEIDWGSFASAALDALRDKGYVIVNPNLHEADG